MRAALLATLLLLAGCAADCGPDWYEIGARDGRLGAYQAQLYASRCSVPVDNARYDEGWQAGAAQRPRIVAF
jgi:hypothetical protein